MLIRHRPCMKLFLHPVNITGHGALTLSNCSLGAAFNPGSGRLEPTTLHVVDETSTLAARPQAGQIDNRVCDIDANLETNHIKNH